MHRDQSCPRKWSSWSLRTASALFSVTPVALVCPVDGRDTGEIVLFLPLQLSNEQVVLVLPLFPCLQSLDETSFIRPNVRVQKLRSGGSLQRGLAAASQGSGRAAQRLKLSKWYVEVKTEFRQVA